MSQKNLKTLWYKYKIDKDLRDITSNRRPNGVIERLSVWVGKRGPEELPPV